MISIFLLTALLTAPPAESFTLRIDVMGIASADGDVAWSLYDSAEAYDSEREPLRKGKADVGEDLSCLIAIEGLAPGEYGVRLYHDENGNGKLDSGRLRRPKEPYGFSNNARGRFGPAAWEAIRFEIGGTGATVEPVRLEVEVK